MCSRPCGPVSATVTTVRPRVAERLAGGRRVARSPGREVPAQRGTGRSRRRGSSRRGADRARARPSRRPTRHCPSRPGRRPSPPARAPWPAWAWRSGRGRRWSPAHRSPPPRRGGRRPPIEGRTSWRRTRSQPALATRPALLFRKTTVPRAARTAGSRARVSSVGATRLTASCSVRCSSGEIRERAELDDSGRVHERVQAVEVLDRLRSSTPARPGRRRGRRRRRTCSGCRRRVARCGRAGRGRRRGRAGRPRRPVRRRSRRR